MKHVVLDEPIDGEELDVELELGHAGCQHRSALEE